METSELKAEVHRSCEGCGRYSIHPDGKNIPVMPQPCNGCYPWDDTDHIRSAWIPADLDAEPPKPTAEPDAMAIIKQALTDYADVFVDLIVERLKDAPPQPAQMICNHAGECKVAGCPSITVHDEVRDCKKIGGVNCPFPDAICVPWVEPVKALMSTCEGCHKEFGDGDCFEECTGYTDSAAFRTMPRHNYTPKEPEPVVHYSCEGCGRKIIDEAFCRIGHLCCGRKRGHLRRNYTPKEPEPAAPEEVLTCEICGDEAVSLTTRMICDRCYRGENIL